MHEAVTLCKCANPSLHRLFIMMPSITLEPLQCSWPSPTDCLPAFQLTFKILYLKDLLAHYLCSRPVLPNPMVTDPKHPSFEGAYTFNDDGEHLQCLKSNLVDLPDPPSSILPDSRLGCHIPLLSDLSSPLDRLPPVLLRALALLAAKA
jgi:hypothetical protein